MSYFAREHILEAFARARKLEKDDVVLVDARFKQTDRGTEVTLSLPLQGAMTIPGDLGDVMTTTGKDFVIQAFEMAVNRTVRNRGWMMAVHNRKEGQPDGETSATYIFPLRSETSHRTYRY